MHEVLVNRRGGLSLPRKGVVRLTDRPDMTLDVYRGRKATRQQQKPFFSKLCPWRVDRIEKVGKLKEQGLRPLKEYSFTEM